MQYIRLIHQGRILTDEMLLQELLTRVNNGIGSSSSTGQYGAITSGLSPTSSFQASVSVGSFSSPLVLNGQLLEEPTEARNDSEVFV